MRVFSSILILTFVLFACETKNTDVQRFLGEFEISKVTTSKREFNDLLAVPMTIFSIDSLFFINEFRREGHLISFWDQKANLVARRFGVGKGPNEYLPPLFLDYWEDTLSLYNTNDFKFRQFSVESNLVFKKVYETEAFLESLPYWIVKLDSNRLVAGLRSRRDITNRFGVYSKNAKLISYAIDDFPEIGNVEKYSTNVKSMIFEGKKSFRPDFSKFVVAGIYSGSIEIFSIDKNLSIKREYEYTVNSSVNIRNFSDTNVSFVNFTDDHPYGFRRVFSTMDYIYLLYSGEPKNSEEEKSRFILVLDWDGNRITGYELDTSLACFTVNEEEKRLTGVSTDYSSLIEFKLIR